MPLLSLIGNGIVGCVYFGIYERLGALSYGQTANARLPGRELAWQVSGMMTRRLITETIEEVSEHSHDDGTGHGQLVFHRNSTNAITGSCKRLSNSDPQMDEYLRGKQEQIDQEGGNILRRHKSVTCESNNSREKHTSSEQSVPKGFTSDLESRTDNSRNSTYISTFAQRWNPFGVMGKIPNPEALKCRRLFIRRDALCDPEQMPMTQDVRERLQKDVERRKNSFARKLSVYIRVRLGTDGEVDLF